MHSTKTTTWDDPRLPSSLGKDADPAKRNFQRKVIYFRSQPAQRMRDGETHIHVNRNSLFEDAFAQIMSRKPEDLKRQLRIMFDSEDGLDYGGLSRCVSGLASSEKAHPDTLRCCTAQ